MNLVYAGGIAAILAVGVYLLLSRHLVRTLYGVMLVSAAVNLVIFLAGRIATQAPPVMAAGQTVLERTAANPLPQALVLTAIVIGFSLVAFMAALVLALWRSEGVLDSRALDAADALGRACAPGRLPRRPAAPQEPPQ